MGTRHRNKLTEFPLRFVTTTFKDWIHVLTREEYFQTVAQSLEFVNKKYKVDLLAYVIMPNHLHLVLFFTDEVKLSDYMRDFKKFTSGELRRQLIKNGDDKILAKLKTKEGSYKVWMDRFDDLVIRNARNVLVKMNYIHQNPVRRNLAAKETDYKYSSARFYDSGEEGILNVTYIFDAIGWQNQTSVGQITYG
jgi:putative transposase